ncbi:hypothetical protein DMN91_011245 [Ooceraea biroi]|uniref:SPRY domain-containing SOCS box protein n=1 Tax=Ooceraea biroi TaxID=2015173 RepID=A0A026WD29_OOCBI|nr:SPRY domain-containing SOCS box protein 3 [Ooceraea biroi]XP_011339511.1 SPRY domain-containing SOCS box protein 3 [Ooceraea biroi]EZA53858.1 SPRY domain-containing SOCS box protein [Ooceraea biroi]RLU17176.1 hypothetical protein DMN91_011245 [Ooceraea biroi]
MDFNTNNHTNQSTDVKPGFSSAKYEWTWKIPSTPSVNCNGLNVVFHPVYSTGTAVVMGNRPFEAGRHHYWEILMLTYISGTDVMIGVGTANADFCYATHKFCAVLGKDRHSWGYSYKGYLQHDDKTQKYNATFNQTDVVGVHLDTWRGTLQYFLNGKPLGVAFTRLNNVTLYPMMSCTMAQCVMILRVSCSIPVSLQTGCLAVLTSKQKKYLRKMFPGLRYLSQNVFADILRKPIDDNEDDIEFPVELEHVIVDDFDYALVGFGRKRKLR